MTQLTQARLKELLHYDQDTGIVSRIQARPGWRPGSRVGTVNNNGYIHIQVDGKKILAHRLAFLWMAGYIPEMVDHINGIRTDNRWSNLRVATIELNRENLHAAHSNNKAGLLGVVTDRNAFRAQIKVDGRRVNLGTFDTPEEAHASYLKAKRELHAGCTI